MKRAKTHFMYFRTICQSISSSILNTRLNNHYYEYSNQYSQMLRICSFKVNIHAIYLCPRLIQPLDWESLPQLRKPVWGARMCWQMIIKSYVRDVRQRKRQSTLRESQRCAFSRRTMRICGFNVKDARAPSMKKSFAQVVTAQYFTGEPKLRKIQKKTKRSQIGSLIGD